MRKAKQILQAVHDKDHEKLQFLGVRAYGNKGRLWSKTACITNLDDAKGQCNPRLASNACDVEDIGCPECIATLEKIAEAEPEWIERTYYLVGDGEQFVYCWSVRGPSNNYGNDFKLSSRFDYQGRDKAKRYRDKAEAEAIAKEHNLKVYPITES